MVEGKRGEEEMKTKDNLYDKNKKGIKWVKTPIALLKSENLTPPEKVCWVLLHIHTYKDPNFSFATQQKLAKDMGVSQSNISRIIKKLINKKLVKKGKKLDKYDQLSSGYYLLDHEVFHRQKSSKFIPDSIK